MDTFAKALDSLAVVLDYPKSDLAERVAACTARLEELAGSVSGSAEAAALLQDFAERTSGMATYALEELYLQTFEMNPIRTLDLGWQLFGEDYNRGLFLVKLRQELRRLGVVESTELPDHTTHVLRLIARMEPEKAEDFTLSCVLSALKKTWSAIAADCPYRLPVEAALRVLASRYAVALEEIPIASPEAGDLHRDVSQDPASEENVEEAASHGASV